MRIAREQKQGKRIKGSGRNIPPPKIPYQTQSKLLSKSFDTAAKSIGDWEKGVEISSDPRAVVPERALVFDLIGPVAEFRLAAQALGLEWLMSDSKDPDSPSEEEENDSAKPSSNANKPNILYVTMPSLAGLKRLIAMWNRFKKDEKPSRDEKAFWDIFGYLHDLRVWSIQDRVDPNIRAYVAELLKQYPNRMVRVELDFWYRSDSQRRNESIDTLRKMLIEVEGELLDLIEIEEIRYQGALISIPANIALEISNLKGSIGNLDDVMTIRPQSELAETDSLENSPDVNVTNNFTEVPSKECITALLDGYPIEHHNALADRITINEVAVTSAEVKASARKHGTGMASLILHGDLLNPTPKSISRPIAAFPVLTDLGKKGEGIAQNKLAIGIIYNTLKKIVEFSESDGPLRNITVINHSICDTNAPFIRRPSPWAMLLDYFSYTHRLLFVVSAGNIFSKFKVEDFKNHDEFISENPDVREASLLLSLEKSKGTRSILSPAEAINAITVGALHQDHVNNTPANVMDPFPNVSMTNLASALGLGVNRSVKPDMVEHGGRFAPHASNHPENHVEVHPIPAVDMGQAAACPSHIGDLDATRRSAGTSNATALITRTCNFIADAVEEIYANDGVNWLELDTRVPILKALLAHSCSWGQIGNVLEGSFPPIESKYHMRRRDTITRFLGYGKPAAERIMSGSEKRITLLGEDTIQSEEMHEFQIPLPTGMFNNRELRSITITLAWSAPTLIGLVDYRGVAMKVVNKNGTTEIWDGVSRALQPNGTTAARGTVIHVKLEGETKKKLLDDNKVSFCVQAFATHETLKNLPIPYALAITMEIAQTIEANIYQEVKDAVKVPIRTRQRERVGG